MASLALWTCCITMLGPGFLAHVVLSKVRFPNGHHPRNNRVIIRPSVARAATRDISGPKKPAVITARPNQMGTGLAGTASDKRSPLQKIMSTIGTRRDAAALSGSEKSGWKKNVGGFALDTLKQTVPALVGGAVVGAIAGSIGSSGDSITLQLPNEVEEVTKNHGKLSEKTTAWATDPYQPSTATTSKREPTATSPNLSQTVSAAVAILGSHSTISHIEIAIYAGVGVGGGVLFLVSIKCAWTVAIKKGKKSNDGEDGDIDSQQPLE